MAPPPMPRPPPPPNPPPAAVATQPGGSALCALDNPPTSRHERPPASPTIGPAAADNANALDPAPARARLYRTIDAAAAEAAAPAEANPPAAPRALDPAAFALAEAAFIAASNAPTPADAACAAAPNEPTAISAAFALTASRSKFVPAAIASFDSDSSCRGASPVLNSMP